MDRFEPLLSSKLYSDKPGVFEKNRNSVNFPVLGSYKFDGWRLFEYNGTPHTRSLKNPKNYHTVETLSEFYGAVLAHCGLRGLDGEAIAGPINHPNAMQNSTSAFSRYGGAPEFTYLIFDSYQHPDQPYWDRYQRLQEEMNGLSTVFPWFRIVEQRILNNWEEVYAMEAEAISLGYEGLMLRSIQGHYKMGRSNFSDGILTALKRFTDSEAEILEILEEMENTNPLEKDAFGRAKRSSHQAGLVGKGRMGRVRCRDKRFTETFTIGMGPGLTHDLRQYIWDHPEEFLHEHVLYSFQDTGLKDRPRHPKWRGIRDKRDMPR